MKKVFLLFGIAAFSAASAQQNDVFDIQKHLQKKQAELKKADKQLKFVIPPFMAMKSYSPNYATNKHDFTYSLPNGDKVIVLGQDNMPCIVPDMSLFVQMPVVGYNKNNFNDLILKHRQVGRIPNAAQPFKMIVSK